MVRQSGFSLIEVLATIFVLSIGLLSLAYLQISSLHVNHAAQLRTVATMQAANMVDRMRANLPGVSAGDYDAINGVGTNPACTMCTPAQVAESDQFDWNTDNALLLPSGMGTVLKVGNVHRITLFYDADRSGATGTGCSGNTQVDLACFVVDVRL